jgi:hypothetical protein
MRERALLVAVASLVVIILSSSSLGFPGPASHDHRTPQADGAPQLLPEAHSNPRSPQSACAFVSLQNLTVPSPIQAGQPAAAWANVTYQGSTSTVDANLNFTLSSGVGVDDTPIGRFSQIGGSPTSVDWYGYVGSELNSTPSFVGTATLAVNERFRAEISFVPSGEFVGTAYVIANATVENPPTGYCNGTLANLQFLRIQIDAAPVSWLGVVSPYFEPLAVIFLICVSIALVLLFERRRRRRALSAGLDDSPQSPVGRR